MAPSDPALCPTVSVDTVADLIVAVPTLVGFHPRDSLILVALGGESGSRIGLTIRVDLPPPGEEIPLARHVARTLLLDSPAGAMVLIVGGGRDPGADPPRRTVAEAAGRALEDLGVEARGLLWAADTTAGAAWRCYDGCRCVGILPDPSTTAYVVAAVVEGQVVRVDRAALAALVAPADRERLRRRERLLVAEIDTALSDPRAGLDGPAYRHALLDAALDDAAAGRLILDDARVVGLALALVDPGIRDEALLRSAGPDAAAAEQLWTALARETPDPEAAEPAVLLAVAALLRGDGALANVALDRAEQAWPGHRLTGLVRSAAEAGMRPAQVRECVTPEHRPSRRVRRRAAGRRR